MRRHPRLALAWSCLTVAGALGTLHCHPNPPEDLSAGDELAADGRRLPTGVALDPAGRSTEIGSFPLALIAAPGGDMLVALLNGHREQGIQVIEVASGRVAQTIPQPAAFLGMAFGRSGRQLYVSGGNQDVVYRYDWREGRARKLPHQPDSRN